MIKDLKYKIKVLFLFYTHTWFKSIIFGLPQVSHVKAALCREGKELGGIRNFRFLIFWAKKYSEQKYILS